MVKRRNNPPPRAAFEVLIVGGGPAGLNAALILGRCRRRVLLCDAGRPRNIASQALHGYLSRDGIAPRDFYQKALDELSSYPCLQFRRTLVRDVRPCPGGFSALLAGGERVRAKKVLLATGVVDLIPPLQGIKAFYGKSVFHCPYCDGWELRDQALAAYGRGRRGSGLALSLLQWSRDVVCCSDGPARISAEARERLRRSGIPLVEKKIDRLEGKNGKLQALLFRDGSRLERRALFFNTPSFHRSQLPEKLNCSFNRKGGVLIHGYGKTCIPGLYAAGNILRDVQLVVVAASEGARAAFKINADLHREDLASGAFEGRV